MRVTYNELKAFADLGELSPQELYDLINAKVIEVDEFFELTPSSNLVIGKTLTKEKHPDADKLNVLIVNVGKETLQIVCGAPNVDANQTVIVALPGAKVKGHEIKKSKIRGVESNGMICSITEISEIEESVLPDAYADGIYVLPDTYEAGQNAIEVLELNDWVYELGLTPNRSDLLSVTGAAYDIAAALQSEKKQYPMNKPSLTPGINLGVIDSAACSYYSAIKIENANMLRYWQNELMLMMHGIKPQNKLVDFSNYAMLLGGQPIHIFDADTIGDAKIGVRFAREGETMVPVVGENTLELSPTDIVVTANDEVIALAGVMGDKAHSVTDATKNIIVEVAVFEPVTVRRTANKFNLRTNASNRFEKGISYWSTKVMQDSIATYIPGKLTSFVENHELAKNQFEIKFDVATVNKFLGINISQEELTNILSALDFEIIDENTVLSPLGRTDIKIKQDLYEEVIRMVGFDAIAIVEESKPSPIKLSEEQRIIKMIRQKLIGANFNEVKTYLLDANECADFTGDVTPIKIANAQSKAHEYIITSNVPNLLKVAKYNIARDCKDLSIFEVRKVFTTDEEEGRNMLSMLMTGSHSKNIINNSFTNVDFYTIKASLWNLLETLGLDVRKLAIDIEAIKEAKAYNPFQSGMVTYDGTPIGGIGKLMPNKYIKNDAYAVEVALPALAGVIAKESAVKEISKFQSMNRDITFEVQSHEEFVNVDFNAMIKTLNISAIENIELVSYFKKETCWSLSFRLTFVNHEETFKSEEIDEYMNKVFTLIQDAGHIIPGLQ